MKTYTVCYTDNINDYNITFDNTKKRDKFIKQLDLSNYKIYKKFNFRY